MIPYLNAWQLQTLLEFPQLLQALDEAFRDGIHMPERHSHQLDEKGGKTLLLMPAWKPEELVGLKVVSIFQGNPEEGLPTIQGLYLLLDGKNGKPLALLDAPMLTNLRTAATSALASRFLSRTDSARLLLVGTGSLAPHMAQAHAQVRPIQEVRVWGRRGSQARRIADNLKRKKAFEVSVEKNLEAGVRWADIVSCATSSAEPLIRGSWLRLGQHLDLVGSFQPHMREADDETVKKARVFADHLEAAPKESGDLALPLQTGILKPQDLQGDLFALCRQEVPGRTHDSEITLFKSVGLALEDYAAAKIAFDRWREQYKEIFDNFERFVNF